MWLEIFSILGFLLLLKLYKIVQHEIFNEKLAKIPIVSKIPVIGSAIVLTSFQPDNLHIKFAEFVKRFGKTFRASLFGNNCVVTVEEKYVEALLSSQTHTRKHLIYFLLRIWLGDGLLLSHGDKWKNMRKIITPTFHFKILEEFIEVFDNKTEIMIKKLEKFADGKTIINVYPLMELATLDIITETAMGVVLNAQMDETSDFVQAVKVVTNIVATRSVRPVYTIHWLFKLFAPHLYKKQIEGVEIMHKFTREIIKKRREKLQAKEAIPFAKKKDDDFGIKKRMALLDVLLQSSTVNGLPLTDEEICDEVNTFLFEGHDTTTSATSFCLYLLSRNPSCQEHLFNEINAHFGADIHRPIGYNDLQKLSYLNCVVKESLRIYPPIPAIGRWLKDDLQLEDAIIPAGTNVIVLLWQMFRDPTIFPDPEKFLPERHLVENTNGSSFSYVPFSAGPRNCVGQRFALLEMKTIVVKVLQNYELLEMGENIHPSIKIVLRSKTGVNFGIRPRVY